MDISNRIDLPKTNELTKKKKIQPVIGLALFIAVVVFGIIKGNVDQKLTLFLMTGLALGYILTRSRYGLPVGSNGSMSPVKAASARRCW